MTTNEESSIIRVIKAVESEIDKTPTGALRNFLCDLNIILHTKLAEAEIAEKSPLHNLMQSLNITPKQ